MFRSAPPPGPGPERWGGSAVRNGSGYLDDGLALGALLGQEGVPGLGQRADGAHLGRQPALLYPAGEFSQLVAVRLDHEEHRAAFGRADPRLAGYRDEGPARPDHCRRAVEHPSADHVQYHIHPSDLLEPLYVDTAKTF